MIKKLDVKELDLKAHNCASCKKRMQCDLFYEQKKINNSTQEYSDMILGLYYTCDEYEPVYIEFPIMVKSITSDLAYNKGDNEKHIGEYCVMSVNAEGYDEEIHLGLYLGEFPLSIISLYDRKEQVITNKFYPNPAIYVFKFNKVFYGMNSRWQFLNSINDLELLKKEVENLDLNYEKIRKNLLTK